MSEWIEVKATLHAIDNPQFQCNKCLSKFAGRHDEEAMLAKSRKLKACEEILDQPRHFLGDKEEIQFSTCIGNFFSYSVVTYLDWQNKFEQGVMPFPGSFSEQPNKVIELFRVIDQYKQDKMKQEIQKQKNRDRANMRGKSLGR